MVRLNLTRPCYVRLSKDIRRKIHTRNFVSLIFHIIFHKLLTRQLLADGFKTGLNRHLSSFRLSNCENNYKSPAKPTIEIVFNKIKIKAITIKFLKES